MMKASNKESSGNIIPPTEALNRFVARPNQSAAYQAELIEQQRYGFTIGTMGFLLASDEKAEVIDITTTCPIPNTPMWFRGVINVRGNLISVINLNLLLAPNDEKLTRWVLIVGEGNKSVGISIDELPVLVDVSKTVNELPPLPDILQSHTKTAFLYKQDIWLEIDFDPLFQQIFGELDT